MKIDLTPAEAEHLYQALSDVKAEGCYYGIKAQYYKRTDLLMAKLKKIMEAD